MERPDGERISRAEAVFVVSLLLIAVVAWAALLLYRQGVWFESGTARIIYRVLWTVLWLPGIAMFSVLLVRRKRVTLAIGLVSQAAAIGLFWWSEEHLNHAGTLALAGLSLPLLELLRGATFRGKCAVVLVIAVALAVAYFGSDWIVFPMLAVPLWMLYACAIWPQVRQAFEEGWRREEEARKKSRAYRWLDRVLIGCAVLYVLFAIAFVACVWLAGLSLRDMK